MPAPPGVPGLGVARRPEAGFWSATADHVAQSSAPPACTPRRQLNRLLENAKTMDAKASTLIAMRSAPVPGDGDGGGGEREVARWGKKIDRKFLIVTAYYAPAEEKLRFEVFNTRSETSHCLVCRHQSILARGDAAVVDVAQAIALDLRFDASRKLVFGPHTPASWVSKD